ncbi:MAG: nucleotidyltransferase family protein [Anaerolineales bacterium]
MQATSTNPALLLEQAVLASPHLLCVLERWDHIALPDSWIVAGAVAQTLWNGAHDLPPGHGIKDIDLIYFDETDLSEEAEAAQARRIKATFSDCFLDFDVKNEARVHLWYAQKFGYPICPYASSRHAIETFPTTATAVGIRPSPSGLEICAPYGVDDLVRLIVRPNKAQITAEIYAAKVGRWRLMWPRLTIIDWNDEMVSCSAVT